MNKVAIITDSISTMPEQMAQEYGVKIIPLYVILDGRDYPETEVDRTRLYERLRRKDKSVTTSSPPTGAYLEAYRELSQQADSILCITFSPSMGMAHGSAVQAAQIAREELPQTTIRVIDSHTTSAAQMLLSLAAARAASQGKSLNEIAEIVNGVMLRLNLVVLLPAPGADGMAKTGRAIDRSNDGAMPRSMAQSIMEMDASTKGIMKIFATVKSRPEGLERLIEIAKERDKGKGLHLAVSYSDTYSEAKKLRRRLLSQFPCTESYLTEDSLIPIIHQGLRAIHLGWYSEE